MSKSDSEFLDRLEATPRYNPSYRTLDSDRLFALARRGAAVQWRPIEEAPKDGTHILTTDGQVQACVYWWPAVWMGTTHNGMKNPTHFMHLSPPPSGEPRDE